MLSYLKKYKKAVFAIVVVLAVIFAGATWLRGEVLKNSTETRLANPNRSEEVFIDTFYYDQLTEKEKAAYELMKARLDGFQGGIIEFEENLNGTEYTRVCNALEYGEQDYFYGFFEIPMTEENLYVKKEKEVLTDVKDAIINKCILFLASAKDLKEQGEYDEEGHVTNLSVIEPLLSENDETKKSAILEKEAKIKETLENVVADMPKEYGQKEAIDYFLEWMRSELSYAADIAEKVGKINNMEGVLDSIYVCSNTSCVLDGYALVNGYCKVLAKLCNMAGIESHVVFGTWNADSAYAMTCVKIGEEEIYVDAAGQYSAKLGNQTYLNKVETQNHLAFVEYFTYES